MSSDNIDYAELDRAVNEAMRTQPKSSGSRSTATKAKPVAATPRPAPRAQRPLSWGRRTYLSPWLRHQCALRVEALLERRQPAPSPVLKREDNENLWHSQLQYSLQLYELWFGVAELGVVQDE